MSHAMQAMPHIKPIVSSRRYTRTTVSPSEHWSILQDGIDKIFDDKVSELSFEKLYTIVYGLVLNKSGPRLHETLSKQLSQHFCSISRVLEATRGLQTLEALNTMWEKQKVYLRQIGDVFIYMDLVYSRRENKPDVFSLGSRLFLTDVVEPNSRLLKDTLVTELNSARNDAKNYLGFRTIRDSIAVLDTLEYKEGMSSVFLTDFEPYLLEKSKTYYRALHDNLLSDPSQAQWKELDTLLQLLNTEDMISEKVFGDRDTITKFHNVAERLLVSDNIKEIAEFCVAKIIRNEDSCLFDRLISLSASQPDKIVIFEQLSKCIMDDVMKIRIDETLKKKTLAAVAWIEELIRIKDRYDELGSRVKSEHQLCTKYTNEGFGKAVNSIPVFCEFLCLYFDTTLRSSTSQLDPNVKKCMYFFRLFRDKDAFELMYRQQLSRRLLQQKSNILREQEFILLLQEDVGASFTSKLRGMVRDMNSSHSFVSKNAKTLSNKTDADLDINVLTQMFWPLKGTNTNKDIVLPHPIEGIKTKFENKYGKVHSGRLLEWVHHLSTVELAYQFKNSYHELSMPILTASIFLLFKDHQMLTFDEIVHLTNIPVQEVRRNLVSMAVAPKTRILKKEPPGKYVSSMDTFSINEDFSASQRKVKVLMVVMNNKSSSSADNAKQESDKKLQESRVTVINAAITRIMKRERKMSHTSLQKEVSELINIFELNSNLFKNSLEYLINNEYIQRDVDNTSVYHYLP